MVKGMDWLGQLDTMLTFMWSWWHSNQTTLLRQFIIQFKLMFRLSSPNAKVLHQAMCHVQLVQMGRLDRVYKDLWWRYEIPGTLLLRSNCSKTTSIE